MTDDEREYSLGLECRRKGDWQGAMNHFLEALSINPESPAKGALEMITEILDFYNKDIYNP
ncbi:MAG: tetratricopeptide repeat protein [Bacteroidales bacterium]|nr:tetratricopeptide repeat protein [Bacteroidales bacterium]